MSRPEKTRQVAAYLRQILGREVPFRDLLRLAAIIVKADRDPEPVAVDEGYVRAAFFALEVDVAFEDGGWRVLEFERKCGMSFE